MEIKIYTLSSTRDPNNIRYVGKTKQPLKRRLSQHITDAKKANKLGIKRNYNYNWIIHELNDGFQILIEELDSMEFKENEDWKWLEQYWISQIRAWGFHLTNLTAGGDGNQHQHFTKESIELRASKIRGVPRDEITKQKISESLKGIKRSTENKKKVKDSVTELQGEVIKQYDKNGNFIKEWPSISEASRQLNIDRANIGHCCAHKPNHNSAGGFIWRYKNDKTPIIPYTSNSICQFDMQGNLIHIYQTATQASKELSISLASISNCSTGKIDSVKGFVFRKYKDL